MLSGVLGGCGHANVAAHCEPHTHVAGDCGEDRAHEEEDASADSLTHGVRGKHEQHEEDDHREDRQGLELTVQVGRCALLDCGSNLLHLVGAFVGGENLAYEDRGDAQRQHGDDGNDDDRGQVHPCQGDLSHGTPQIGAWTHASDTQLWGFSRVGPLPNAPRDLRRVRRDSTQERNHLLHWDARVSAMWITVIPHKICKRLQSHEGQPRTTGCMSAHSHSSRRPAASR